MSIPKNHHYVSQCHIEKFFNSKEGKIFYYDKEINNYDYKTTTKSIFSEPLSNSRVINNEIDHKGLEDELNKKFETPFLDNFNNVKKTIDNPTLFVENIKSFIDLTKFGIISDLRHPAKKFSVDSTITDVIKNKIQPYATPELSEEIDRGFSYVGKTKYSNTISYSEFADSVFDFMGVVTFDIFEITTDDFFILPDKYALINRVPYAPDSLGRVIALVGFPISSKIFFSAVSERLEKTNRKGKFIRIGYKNRQLVKLINDDLYNGAIKTVACENENYLHRFINGEIK